MLQTLGRYEVLRPIATGGMATVYLGRVSAAGGFERLVAIKVMHPHIANELDFVTMFLDEARLAARIRHQNVVATHDVDQAPEGLFLVMDYVDGPALHLVVKTVARRREIIPHDVLLRIFSDVLEGLHAAHELRGDDGKRLGLVHRDVSPHNILIGNDGVSRITDFGVAHARTRLTSTQGANLKGKVAYLAPEQVLTGRVDRRSDVFSAGIVLWEALTRRRLFKGQTEGQTLAQIIAGARTAPHLVDPNVPHAISNVCMRALAGNPPERFQSAAEFSDALESAARQIGIPIARSRQVASFIDALEIQETLPKTSSLPPSAISRSQSQISAQRIASALGSVPTPAAPEPAPLSSDPAPPSATEPSKSVAGSLVDIVLEPPPRRSRVWLLAVAALFGVAAAASVIALPSLRALTPFGAAAIEPAAAAEQPPAPTAAAPAPSPSPEPEAPKVESTERDAGSSVAKPAAATTAGRPPAAARIPPAAAPAAPRRDPKPSATSYKPSEL